jgi:hypothetical protein
MIIRADSSQFSVVQDSESLIQREGVFKVPHVGYFCVQGSYRKGWKKSRSYRL